MEMKIYIIRYNIHKTKLYEYLHWKLKNKTQTYV